MKKLLTADEVAELLSVDRSTVYDWARTGELPAFRLGRVVRFDPDLLVDWLSGHQVGKRAPRGPVSPARGSRVQRLHTAVSRKVVAGMMAAQE